jgi:uroporphyrinogen-III synthase
LPPQKGLRLVHLCSRASRLEPDAFSGRGLAIRNLCVYAPHCPADVEPALRAAWPQVRAVLFASGSAAGNLFATTPVLGRTLGTANGPRTVSIGSSATEALRANGVVDIIQASTANNQGLVTALNAVPRK